jgi:(1->4)-alpha-D-glucan 1-alpha-D-glucosylmutase
MTTSYCSPHDTPSFIPPAFCWSPSKCQERSFCAQRDAAARALHMLLACDLKTRDWSMTAVKRVLTEILVHFRVYRTYAGEESAPLDRAIEKARQSCLPADRPLFDILAHHLREEIPADCDLQAEALARFRQLSAPVAAKSVEDTAFYRYGRLLSRTDVGTDPRHFALDAESFHKAMRRRGHDWPHAMLATATHDHKLGEDIRARLAVLSEVPEFWTDVLGRALHASANWQKDIGGRHALANRDRAILMQMIAGAWPLDLDPGDRSGCSAFAERLGGWQTKALREAKLDTSCLTRPMRMPRPSSRSSFP